MSSCPQNGKAQRYALTGRRWFSLRHPLQQRFLWVDWVPGKEQTPSEDSDSIALGRNPGLYGSLGDKRELLKTRATTKAQDGACRLLPHTLRLPTWVPAELAWQSALEPRALGQGHQWDFLALCTVALGLCWQQLLLLVPRTVSVINHHWVLTVLELQSQRECLRTGGEGPSQPRPVADHWRLSPGLGPGCKGGMAYLPRN